MEVRRLLGPVLGLAAATLMLVVVLKVSATTTQPAAYAQPSAPANGITVAGVGRVTVEPDMALLRLGVQTQGETAAAAQQANAQKMGAVVRALKDLEIGDADIQTSRISLQPMYERGRDADRVQIVGYEASNVVMVRATDLGKVGSVLDKAVQAGANTAGGIQFGLRDDAEQRKEALKKAVQNAQGKAEAIASATGRTVGAVESVAEESVSFPRPMDAARALEVAPAISPTPIEPGELEVTATVRVVYGLQ